VEITERRFGDVTVLDLRGKILIGEGNDVLREKIAKLVAAGRKKIVLCLTDVPYVDSAGAGEIVRSFDQALRAGGALKLLTMSQKVRALFELVKLIPAFEFYENEMAAVGSFSRKKDGGA
jgi:anti-sigma B factor antagonist